MKPILIFSGANDRAVIAFCRYAERTNIKCVIVANGEEDLIFLTDYKKDVIATRKRNMLTIENLLEYVNRVKLKFLSKEVFILPSTEYLNRFLLNNKEDLDKSAVRFGLCDKKLYDKISDKYQFGTLCSKYGVKVPIEYKEKPTVFPYVVKPKRYFDDNKKVNFKPLIIYNKEQEVTFLDNVDRNELYFQQYVSGKSIYLLYYFFKDKSYSVYSQENFVQQSLGGSMIYCKSSNYHLNASLSNPFSELFISEGFNGLVMIEVKEYDNQFYMIEANPRLWGPSQLILDAKMSLFDDFSIQNDLINANEAVDQSYIVNKNYFWSGGINEDLNKNANSMFYNYNIDSFLNENDCLLKDEIYYKKDTLQVYIKENK